MSGRLTNGRSVMAAWFTSGCLQPGLALAIDLFQ